MRKRKKLRLPAFWFIVVLLAIVFLTLTNVFGLSTRYGDTVTPVIKSASEIRFGIDIRGGVDVSFVPADGSTATAEQMDAAQAVIEQRLVSLAITDYELYKDTTHSRLILRFPWKEDETNFNPESAIQELAATAMLTFRMGSEQDETTGGPTGVTAESIILQGNDVTRASVQYGPVATTAGMGQQNQYFISLELTAEGLSKFSQATADIVASDTIDTMSIWMDNQMISAPQVSQRIDSNPIITGGSNGFDPSDAKALADRINAGALPFALQAESYSTISPTLGSQALRAMVIAGILALVLVAGFMIFNYRLPGAVAGLALMGQTMATIALISGYFVVFQSFTLTLPGIAGIILAVGMGVDANVITGERIKEELRSGKKLDVAIRSGFQRGITPIIDSNVTVLIVAIILMGAFGPTDGFFAKLLYPIFFAFGSATAGNIYSFGYTLLIGVLLNFVFGVFANRVMLTSLSKLKALRNPVLYGAQRLGKKEVKRNYLNVVGNRNKFFGLSIGLIAVILAVSLIFGVKADVQFTGGAIITYSYRGSLELGDLQPVVDEALSAGSTLQEGTNAATGASTLTITMPGSQTVDAAGVEKLTAALDENFSGNHFEQLELSNISATMGREFLAKCIVALLAAAVLILIYIAFRFRKIGGWLGGCTAVIALLHDLVIIYGVFVLLRIPLSGNFIAALLTILGYSINDTVVIYDRVRENRLLYGKKRSFAEIVNLSINQSLTRSINTTLTTLLALGCVCIFGFVYGLDSIFTFAFPMMLGMVSGVYSSICIAGPLWARVVSGKKASSEIKVESLVPAKAAAAIAASSKAVPIEDEEETDAEDSDKTDEGEETEEADAVDDADSVAEPAKEKKERPAKKAAVKTSKKPDVKTTKAAPAKDKDEKASGTPAKAAKPKIGAEKTVTKKQTGKADAKDTDDAAVDTKKTPAKPDKDSPAKKPAAKADAKDDSNISAKPKKAPAKPEKESTKKEPADKPSKAGTTSSKKTVEDEAGNTEEADS